MGSIVSQRGGTGYMQPLQLAFDAQAALVKVDHICRLQCCLHLVIDWLYFLFQSLVGCQHTGLTQLVTIQVTKDGTGASQGDQLIDVEVAGLSLDAGSILHSLRLEEKTPSSLRRSGGKS